MRLNVTLHVHCLSCFPFVSRRSNCFREGFSFICSLLQAVFTLRLYYCQNFSNVSLLPVCLFVFGATAPQWARASSFTRFLDHTSQSVGLIWTNDQLVAETSTWHHTTLTTDRHPYPRWDSNPQTQQANGCRPTSSTARPLEPAITACSLLFLWTSIDWSFWTEHVLLFVRQVVQLSTFNFSNMYSCLLLSFLYVAELTDRHDWCFFFPTVRIGLLATLYFKSYLLSCIEVWHESNCLV
jgi:hypothetical protein